MIFDGDRDYIGPYLRYLADNMGLRDWFLEVSQGVPTDFGMGSEVNACCAVQEPYIRATIAVADGWEDWDEDEFRWVMVHELLHCHTSAPVRLVRSGSSPLGELIHGTMMDALNDAVERMVDNIAYNWSLHLPLPSEWLEFATKPGGMA